MTQKLNELEQPKAKEKEIAEEFMKTVRLTLICGKNIYKFLLYSSSLISLAFFIIIIKINTAKQ